jgi:hypothetical protein
MTGKLARNLGLLLVATLIALAMAEMVVRAFVPVRNVGPSFTTYIRSTARP